jgi:isobutyryl-CoA mutase
LIFLFSFTNWKRFLEDIILILVSPEPILTKNKIRIVTAASLFDGHDASINIMRRILQTSGAEVIHLGHNRSVKEVMITAIQEDAQAIALTSYQGGHVEYFKYLKDLLDELKASHIKIFGGGGGTILPDEIEELHNYGIGKIYSPDDGRRMGLQGMINQLLNNSDYSQINVPIPTQDFYPFPNIARAITFIENNLVVPDELKRTFSISDSTSSLVIGITGTGGSGKSSLTDELVRRLSFDFPNKKIAILSVDPTKRKTGGALLGDRIRMNSIYKDTIFMRSLATREINQSISKFLEPTVEIFKSANFDFIILETAGIGQSDTQITEISDISIYVMTPEYGASSQLEKIDMIDFADLIAINKSDRKGAEDALRDVKKQYQRSHNLFHENTNDFPVFKTNASQFNDIGVNLFYNALLLKIEEKKNQKLNSKILSSHNKKIVIMPADRVRYLAEIVEEDEKRTKELEEQIKIANEVNSIQNTISIVSQIPSLIENLKPILNQKIELLTKENRKLLDNFPLQRENYSKDEFTYTVRNKNISINNKTVSLTGIKIPKVATPKYSAHGDILKWLHKENFPGNFPYTAGVYPFKRANEDPTRMFAGEGNPERTNKRFHYLSKGQPAIRLSTAFDSVTLYGENPDKRPDIYGKIGNSGVSVATLDDAKILYSGFDLCDTSTSVSMTINGPAPTVLALFLNACIDQQCEIYIRKNGLVENTEKYIQEKYKKLGLNAPSYNGILPETNQKLGLLLLGVSGDEVLPKEIYEKIKVETLSKVRGTVQADILKEDQAQNTCIFSTEFSLKLMGDVQEYFIQKNIRNFYSVSISGYHMAEAGANPISQLAFTLANGFTFVEYYISRGMKIDDFCPNFSFFFSNGVEPEYNVLGRVARRIWAKAIRFKYNGNERSQMLKYHIQTSGRSLHSQEIQFNDIRTTLQALSAIYDNCNSLHTNAYDEAITTPTEESVRRAVAIQLIINRELGLAKNENPLQGSFIIEELTDLVEEAVYLEFKRLSDRGGVLGAMETMYQRNKIQDESLYYEEKKHSGEYPIIGVNTFLDSKGSPTVVPLEVVRSTEEEKNIQIERLEKFHRINLENLENSKTKLEDVAMQGENIFATLMEAVKSMSLGQITESLYRVGGQYRRNT